MAGAGVECFLGSTTSVTPRLKLWNSENKVNVITKASTSNDGELIALLTDSHSVNVTHVSKRYEDYIVVDNIHSFIWGVCDWKNEKCLTYPTADTYLTTLGIEHEINIFSFSNNGDGHFASSILTSIEPCLLRFDEEVPSINHVSIICSLCNMDGTSHQVMCVINKLYIIQMLTSTTEETYVATKLSLDKLSGDRLEYKDHVKMHEYKDGLIYLLTEDLMLYILVVADLQLKKKINIYEKLQLYDVLHFGVSSNGDSHTVTLITSEKQITFLKLPSLIQNETLEHTWSHGDIWKDMLKHTKTLYKANIHLQSEFDDFGDKCCDITSISLPDWLNDFHIIDFHVTNSIVLLLHENIQNTKQKILTKYNSLHDEFVFNEMSSDTSLSFCSNEYFPMLFVSPRTISIPTFSTTQEELIDKIIQYSDIHLAESICKSNQWDQFSIPLHTLEIGLQQRQLDVISFFLKSREKVFTRYWEEIKNSLTSDDSRTVDVTYNESSDSNEMCDAIEMLVKAIHSNSKGKHKQNFFEGLLRISIIYLNGLLQDGVVAMEIKSKSSGPDIYAYNEDSSVNSSYLYDVSKSLKYLTGKLIELRTFLRHPIEEDRQVQEADEKEIDVTAKCIEEHLINGRIAALQKLFHQQGRKGETKLSNIVDIGRTAVNRMLKEQNIEKAEKILRNLGLDSNNELKEIYLKTIERSLRDFLYTVLKDKGLLTDQHLEDYVYVKKVEELYTEHHLASNNNGIPATASLNESSVKSFTDPKEQTSDDEHILFCQFSLEHVKSWDEKKRRLEMLDAIFINDAEVTIGNEYSSELWDYLISHNEITILQTWIGNVTSPPDIILCNQTFPDLPEDMPMDFITTDTKETLLHLLVKNGYYPQCIMTSFSDLLSYLSVNNILFADVHPMVFYKKNICDEERNELVNQFHHDFICFCQDNELVMVMWHYICHYGISLSTITIKDKIKAWLSMMLSFHDVATKWKESTTDKEGLLFTAFSENARFLNDESANCSEPYTLNDMLRNNQPIIALASVLVCQNKFADVFTDSDGSIHHIDKKLLEESLHLYPQLYEAICNGDSNNDDCGVSMYKLLQDNTELDVSRWFCWQPNNDMAARDHVMRELPHFSSPFLIKKYAQEVKLDHMFYLEQGRPMYAYLVYMRDLASVEDKHSLGKNIVTLDTYRLGIENFNKLPIIASCSFFLDLLDVDNMKLKTDARVAINISKYWNWQPSNVKEYSADELKNYLIESFLQQDKANQLMEILKLLENTTEVILMDNKVKRLSYDAVWYWQLVMSFCRIHKLPLSTRYIEVCCEEDDWLQLFLFIHLYQLPPEQVVSVVESHMKNKILRDHIIAIVRNIKSITLTKPEEKHKKRKSKDIKSKPAEKRDVRAHLYSRLGSVSSRDKEKFKEKGSSSSMISSAKKEERSNSANTLSPEEQTHFEIKDFHLPDRGSIPDNVIDIILTCDMHTTPWKSLLAYGIVLFNEIFPPLAACYEDADMIVCQCVWYICSISEELHGLMLAVCKDVFGVEISIEALPLALHNHSWNERDLLILVKGILKEGVKYSKLIVQGFKIFRQGDIRKHILEFYQIFIFDEESHLSLDKIKEFQVEYETNRKKNAVESSFKSNDDIKVCEEFSYEIVQVLLSSCKHTYHVRKLIGQLADANYGHGFSIKVPAYASIRKTIDIIYKTDVVYAVKKLCVINQGFNMEHINEIFNQLLKASYFNEANDLAELHCLPQSKITRQKVVHDLEEMSKTRSWKLLSTRYAFMNKVDKIFIDSKCCCNLAASFFEEQASSENTIYTNIERSFLLLLAMQWYHTSIIGDKSTKLNDLEKEVWMYQIKAEVEMENSGPKDNIPLIRYTLTPNDMCDISQAYFQRTCSSITMAHFNDLTELLQEIKEEEEEEEEDGVSTLLSTEEEHNAFERFIGKLLDKNCITEARRVASYFKRTTVDLEVVLAGIYLAQGNETVDGLGDNIKSILAATTSRHISISALMERSGSFTRPETLHSPVVPSAGCMTDFVFIEEIQNALEKLTLRVKCGKKCLQQVLVSFKIATMLSLSYEDTVTEDFYVMLRQVLAKGIDQRRQLSKQFIKAFDLPSDEMSNFVAETMINWIKISCGIDVGDSTLNNKDLSVLSSRTFDDIVSLLQLIDDAAQVGKLILEEMIRLSKTSGSRTASDLTCEVELLIYAHHCFTISCEMEGIARILHFAGLCTKSLARLQLHSQMVRLLTGIGRFNEMVYVIETLYNQHHFELLCKQGHLKEKQLKTALLDFLKKYHPKDHDNFRIVAHAFGMHREMAKHHESVGLEKIDSIKNEMLNSNKDLVGTLKDIKETFTCAADYYVKEECLRHAQTCIRTARLAELQIQLLPAGLCVLGLTRRNVGKFLREHKNFLESYIVADSYDLNIPSCWSEPIYHIVVLNGNFNYLQQYQSYFHLTATMATEVATLFRREKNIESSGNMKNLLSHVRDLKTKLKLAKELNFTDIETQLLEGTSGAYLRDHLF